MKKRIMFSLLFFVAGVAVISLADGTAGEKQSTDGTVIEMRAEIDTLRAQVQTLEERTKKLESMLEKSNRPHSPVPLVLPQNGTSWLNPPAESPKPKIWGQKEVNGWTFYIVPCEQQIR